MNTVRFSENGLPHRFRLLVSSPLGVPGVFSTGQPLKSGDPLGHLTREALGGVRATLSNIVLL